MQTGYVTIAILWLIVLVPGVFFLLIHIGFRAMLWGRRNEIKSIMSRGKTLTLYLDAFGSPGGEKGQLGQP